MAGNPVSEFDTLDILNFLEKNLLMPSFLNNKQKMDTLKSSIKSGSIFIELSPLHVKNRKDFGHRMHQLMNEGIFKRKSDGGYLFLVRKFAKNNKKREKDYWEKVSSGNCSYDFASHYLDKNIHDLIKMAQINSKDLRKISILIHDEISKTTDLTIDLEDVKAIVVRILPFIKKNTNGGFSLDLTNQSLLSTKLSRKRDLLDQKIAFGRDILLDNNRLYIINSRKDTKKKGDRTSRRLNKKRDHFVEGGEHLVDLAIGITFTEEGVDSEQLITKTFHSRNEKEAMEFLFKSHTLIVDSEIEKSKYFDRPITHVMNIKPDGSVKGKVFYPRLTGDLHTLLTNNELSYEEKELISLQLLEILKYLENAKTEHGDLKLENILYYIDSDGHVHIKLTDYSTMRSFTQSSDYDYFYGSLLYAAPEVVDNYSKKKKAQFRRKPSNNKSDVFSAGIALMAILEGNIDHDFQRARGNFFNSPEDNSINHSPKLKVADKKYRKLIQLMTKKNPEERISGEAAFVIFSSILKKK